jgi:DNA-binding protein HU-beta
MTKILEKKRRKNLEVPANACIFVDEFLITFFKFLKTNIMNKAELVDAIAGKAGLTKADAKRSLDAFTEIVAKSLKKGDKIALVGFGTFSVSQRSARTGRNPRTGEPIKIKAKKVAKFKAGGNLSF